MAAIRESHGSLRTLLDEQHSQTALANGSQSVEDDVDDRRRETERRLVEQENGRIGDERTRDRKLLLLTAGQDPSRPTTKLLDDRKEVVSWLEIVVAGGPTPAPGESEPP